MKITQALLGEHGAMYPLLDMIEQTATSAGLMELKLQAAFLQATLISHADIEDALLRPVVLPYLEKPTPGPDGAVPPTDHQAIAIGLQSVIDAGDGQEARRLLMDTVTMTRKHFRKEENIIFPTADRELSLELLEDLGAQWAAIRKLTVPSRTNGRKITQL
ncbi:MAG: hemerythrin domain-containing protein [Acidobacteria bacterium]|nr:hemerythrin domain-containing protein [Acidobacteriota bacterium]